MTEKEYITKELYEADKQATIAKCEVEAANIRTEGAEMRGNYNLIKQELSEIRQSLEKFISRATLALGIAAVLFTAVQITLTIIALRK